MVSAHIEDKVICTIYTRGRDNLIFGVSHDMEIARKLHCRPAVLKYIRHRNFYIANFLNFFYQAALFYTSWQTIVRFVFTRSIKMGFYIFKWL